MDIREVARRSGVSVATVSRALNNRPDVSPATRERVVLIARELGYQPNQQARTLVRRRSDLVGVLWDTSYLATRGQHPFLQDLLVGLKEAFAETGHHLMLLVTADAGTDSYVRVARQHSLDGLVLMGVDEHLAAISALLASGRPCVGIDLPLHGPRAGYVTSDNRAGAEAAVAHLHGLGHRRIATITGPLDLMPAAERLAGYRSQLARLGLSYRPDYVQQGDFFLTSGETCMRRLLALDEPPTAVFVAGDEMAIGALHALADAGVDVPGAVSIVGYDDIEAAALVRPGLTTIAQDRAALASAAAAMLAELIASHPTDARRLAGPPAPTDLGQPDPGQPDDAGQPVGPAAAGGGAAAGEETGTAPRVVPSRLVIRQSCGPGPAGHAQGSGAEQRH